MLIVRGTGLSDVVGELDGVEGSTTVPMLDGVDGSTTMPVLDRVDDSDAGRMTTQLGTPRGRYDEHSSKFSLSKKARFIDPVGKIQT
jgi:hypothetical protein